MDTESLGLSLQLKGGMARFSQVIALAYERKVPPGLSDLP